MTVSLGSPNSQLFIFSLLGSGLSDMTRLLKIFYCRQEGNLQQKVCLLQYLANRAHLFGFPPIFQFYAFSFHQSKQGAIGLFFPRSQKAAGICWYNTSDLFENHWFLQCQLHPSQFWPLGTLVETSSKLQHDCTLNFEKDMWYLSLHIKTEIISWIWQLLCSFPYQPIIGLCKTTEISVEVRSTQGISTGI